MELFAEAADVAIQKNLLAYHTMMQASALNERAKALQAYITGDPYYMEAGEPNGKAKNFLVRAWEALIRFLRMIKEKLFGKKIQVEPGDKVVVSKPFAVALRKLKGAWASVKGFLKAGKGKLSENPKWKILMGLMAALTVAGGVFFVIRKRKKKNTSELEEPEIPTNAVELPAEELRAADDVVKDITETVTGVAEDKKREVEKSEVPSAEEIRKNANMWKARTRSHAGVPGLVEVAEFAPPEGYDTEGWLSELDRVGRLAQRFRDLVWRATIGKIESSSYATDYHRWENTFNIMDNEINDEYSKLVPSLYK